VPDRRHPTSADDLLDPGPDQREGEAERLQRLAADTVALPQQAQQEVLGPDVAVVQQPGFLLREPHDLPGPVGEATEDVPRPRPPEIKEGIGR